MKIKFHLNPSVYAGMEASRIKYDEPKRFQ